MRSAMVHERDDANDILDTAERITFVTVWTAPVQLVKQITAAEIDPAVARGKRATRHRKIRELYHDPAKVIEHYERWFRFAESKSSDHIVASPHEGMRLRSIAEWRELVAASPQLGAAASR
jgi:hypothetical protein